MRKEEMRKTVNEELKTLMPLGLDKTQQKLWRLCFNMDRQNDLSRKNPKGGAIISRECIESLKQTKPEDFPADMKI